MSHREPELSSCIRRMVEDYFRHLEGERCQGLHTLVMECVEKPLLTLVFEHTEQNLSRASEILGMNRSTLRKKLASYGIK